MHGENMKLFNNLFI